MLTPAFACFCLLLPFSKPICPLLPLLNRPSPPLLPTDRDHLAHRLEPRLQDPSQRSQLILIVEEGDAEVVGLLHLSCRFGGICLLVGAGVRVVEGDLVLGELLGWLDGGLVGFGGVANEGKLDVAEGGELIGYSSSTLVTLATFPRDARASLSPVRSSNLEPEEEEITIAGKSQLHGAGKSSNVILWFHPASASIGALATSVGAPAIFATSSAGAHDRCQRSGR